MMIPLHGHYINSGAHQFPIVIMEIRDLVTNLLNQ
jgi:hypothetical protein